MTFCVQLFFVFVVLCVSLHDETHGQAAASRDLEAKLAAEREKASKVCLHTCGERRSLPCDSIDVEILYELVP